MTAPTHPVFTRAMVEQRHADLLRSAHSRARRLRRRAAHRERLGWLLVAYGLRLITSARPGQRVIG